MLKSAYACRRAGLTTENATALIKEHLTRAPRPGEIEKAVAKAYGIKKDNAPRAARISATYNYKELSRVAGKIGKFGRAELMRKSPVPTDISAFDFLTHLYSPTERIFLTDEFTSREGSIWARHYDGQKYDPSEMNGFVRPEGGLGAWFLANPITGEALCLERLKSPWNPQGWTIRSEENLAAFRYMVLESDHAPEDMWIKALAQAPVPIVSIVTSGGNSIHALVKVDAKDKGQWDRVKGLIAPRFVELGADPNAITAVRLTRLPGCYRAEKDKMQELLFLNPWANGQPICSLPDQVRVEPTGRRA